ncbi:phosphoglycerate mutase family protein [Aspergillus heteromorphus CBS 117.55]|uniref:Phosphoglycerate mutase family protein n=1 Tax=Aspergillus heteromorphus CBS 117.55 TaxID=1448321 RepID=A0A317W3H8_9EURO|nr:phosphoglycerate mutase family protein [Aspergillus heteromorphus CBS 117.55]PWY80479.1 phosphoglycerate mutase family protein [Aspergillus heteromorphus CBS 117.55]
MGNPPAAIIIARHGARLDAADKNWHLTSPTPYDPPLTYGGWLQSRALGARIIDLVQSLDDREDSNTHAPSDPKQCDRLQTPKPKPKRRIIVHTSPFTRCLQTAIAVSSGICQNSPEPEFSQPSTLVQPSSEPSSSPGSVFSPGDHRCLLRVDAFLGEWLCPDYFDEIIPPPKSERMVAAAKLELLRREHGFVPQADTVPRPATGYFPGGWGSGSASTPVSPANDQPAPTPAMNQTQGRTRAGSCDTMSAVETTRGRRMLRKINTSLLPIPDGAYMPPTPSYAISPSGPIPAGYVTHARDACVKIDFQWDSMQGEQNWGDGGEHGEEWSTMHTRFRTGLDRMISWYQDHDPSVPTGRPRRHSQMVDGSEDSIPRTEDDATETILIVITHGAGCNALIGAISGQPALVNINTASLTLATRQDSVPSAVTESGPVGGPVRPKRSTDESPHLENYSLKLIASTEHLRTGGRSSAVQSPSNIQSPSVSPWRNRVAALPALSQGLFIIGPSSTSGAGTQPWNTDRPATAVTPRSAGLWGSIAVDGSADEIVPNFEWPAAPAPTPAPAPLVKTEPKPEDTSAIQLPQRTQSQRGLWGSALSNKEREVGQKRRWTVTERRP